MMSPAIVCALVVLCSVLSVNSSPAATYIQSKADQSLMNYMMKPKTIDSSNSFNCFNYYIPVLNGITETYQKNYEICLTDANEKLDELDEQGNEVRTSITNTSDNVCSLFKECQSLSDNLNFFDCYTNLGDQTVRQVYNVSQDASKEAATYREMSRVITANCDRCTNDTQRVYVTDTANTYDELDDCLINGLKTTVAPTTVDDTTTTEEPITTTEEPITTTEEPITTTEEPITTTEEPITTTEEPITTTEEPITTTEEPITTTEEPVSDTTAADAETPERDPVEELKFVENTARSRLESFVKNWSKRST